MLRLLIWPLLAFAAVLIPGAIRAEPAPARIVAVGDLHGDHDAWLAIARAAGLVDAKGRWAGGRRCSSSWATWSTAAPTASNISIT